MADESQLSFDELVEHRHGLQEFCYAEYESIVAFKDGPSFKVYSDDDPRDPESAHHLSSSATCYEALLDCPQKFIRAGQSDFSKDASGFVELALKRSKWTSDGSAQIYCRCRTLPLVIRVGQRNDDGVTNHVKTILEQLKDNARLAIGEASGDQRQDWYPPNAYHTYWTLGILESFEAKFQNGKAKLESGLGNLSLTRVRAEMLLWAHKTVAYQVALHSADSPALDSDQLAWALAILLRFGSGFEAEIGEQDFIRTALRCLFERQNTVGIWRTGRPLFHYKKSGNAYCYVFETFTVLLKSALTTREGTVFLRQALQPYGQHLLKLWSYAKSTRISLPNSKAFAWSSGHRPNRKEAESWATASVYSYVNCLRRLIGIWTRETSARVLSVSRERGSEKKAVQTIVDRGDTWSRGPDNVAVQLMTLFVNPISSRDGIDPLEPDNEPIQDKEARGAILFGPPGTSKTTLSRSVANAIGWDYVELYASHFVAGGLPEVQRTADRIFKQLMQLDRTVVLFDEIDELVREREMESDAFGRFLTTSMLPRLAELWKRRKVMYFVATNHIEYFDSAIVRAERFDAIVHVPPPSFPKKIARLKALLKERGQSVELHVDRKSVDESLSLLKSASGENSDALHTDGAATELDKNPYVLEIVAKDRSIVRLRCASAGTQDDPALPERCVLAKFLLIRWDQLEELATIITKLLKDAATNVVTKELFEAALKKIADPFLNTKDRFLEYLNSEKYERRDYSKSIVWEVRPCDPANKSGRIRRERERCWHDSFDFDIPSEFKMKEPGLLEPVGSERSRSAIVFRDCE
jgi:hypothetical protein